MKINKLEWDSTFFGKKIGEIFLKDSKTEIENSDFDLIVVKQTLDFKVSIDGYAKTFEEIKITFKKDLKFENDISTEGVNDTDLVPKEWDLFKPLAYESGKKSRFLLDKNFGEEKFEELYNQWVINSINKKFASKFFYIENDLKPVSFVTIQQSGNTGKIGLIASKPEFQGKGYGTTILKIAENFCFNNEMTQMEIPTQKENIQACNFYEKMGYQIKEELIIKHFWRINDSIQ